jgi:hypothetical protein
MPEVHHHAGSSATYGQTLWGIWLVGEDLATTAPAALCESAALAQVILGLPGMEGAVVLPVRAARLGWNAKPPPTESAGGGSGPAGVGGSPPLPTDVG